MSALLLASGNGSSTALDGVFALLYDELRVLAARHLQEPAGSGAATLSTTALVHEAYLRLAAGPRPAGTARGQFFALASTAMRHILVDHLRRSGAAKRGGNRLRITLQEDTAAVEAPSVDLLALDEALERLATRAPRLEKVVECRYFGGLSVEETAEALDVSVRTVERDWTRARGYLYRMLCPDPV